MNELIEKKKKWELLYDAIKEMNYGDIITHEQIEGIIEEQHGVGRYNSIISRARKELIESGKEIEAIHGQGYRVLQPGQYADKAVGCFQAGFRKMDKGKNLLTKAPLKHMTIEEQNVHRQVYDKAKEVHAALAGSCTTLNMLSKKDSPFLPENISKK